MDDSNQYKKTWLFLGVTPTLLSFAISLLAPLDILDRLPLLQPLVNLLIDWIPSLSGFIALSPHPQVTAVFFAVSWTLLPLQTAVCLYIGYRYGDFRYFKGKSGMHGRAMTTLAGLVLSTGTFIVLFWIPREWSLAESWGMNRSRFGLAYFGSVGFLFIAVGFSLFAISVVNYCRGR